MNRVVEEVEEVEEVERNATEQQQAALPWTSTRTVILETGEHPLTEETQSVEINSADVLCEHVVSLLCYLDEKLKKYAGQSNV